LITHWLLFIVLSVVVYSAGGRLTYYGDVLGEKWSVERSFIGLILLSTVTSLPEVATSLSSILLVNSPDLALGNVLGSNLFNIFIIPVLALLYRDTFLNKSDIRHSATGNLVLIIYAMVGMALSLRIVQWNTPTILHMSPFSLAIFLTALIGIYVIFTEEQIPDTEGSLEDVQLYSDFGELKATVLFILCAIAVIGAGAGLAVIGKTLSQHTGLGESFFGTLFFAFVTSLPEVVVSWMALKQLEAVNLAMGNIMGSCLFNLGIIFIFDLASTSLPVFVAAGASHLVSVYAGVIMIALTSYAILVRQRNPADRFFSYEMVTLSSVYLFAVYIMYLLR